MMSAEHRCDKCACSVLHAIDGLKAFNNELKQALNRGGDKSLESLEVTNSEMNQAMKVALDLKAATGCYRRVRRRLASLRPAANM